MTDPNAIYDAGYAKGWQDAMDSQDGYDQAYQDRLRRELAAVQRKLSDYAARLFESQVVR